MPDWAQIISDALDILKFDGAVQDTLAELRGKWGAQVPALLDERFDAIGIQYMKLPHEKGAAALGQELSAFGWALYNLDDEDEYLFALIPEEERNEWERYCKKQGQYCHLMKQQGRKWGDHAKEQDPGKLMPCEEYILQDEFYENDSEIETVARDCIGVTVAYILEWFGIPIDIEEAIRERDW